MSANIYKNYGIRGTIGESNFEVYRKDSDVVAVGSMSESIASLVHAELASVCAIADELHEENEALREVVESAKAIDECIEVERGSLVVGSYGALYKLQQALKKLNPPTKEELLKARLDAADDLFLHVNSRSSDLTAVVVAYEKAKKAHES